MRFLLDFDYKKATQAINYLAVKEGGKINKMKAIKLIYFAERYHLRQYGRLITNDRYVAMKLGPVGSTIRDIIDSSVILDEQDKDYSKMYISQTENPYVIKSINNVDKELFSETDIEALEFSYSNFSEYKVFDLAELTHSYPEWSKFKKDFEQNKRTVKDMDYNDFFLNAKINDDKFAEEEDKLELAKEVFIENSKIAQHLI